MGWLVHWRLTNLFLGLRGIEWVIFDAEGLTDLRIA
jgi:hypothetical protein